MELIHDLKDKALRILSTFLEENILSTNPMNNKSAKLLSYWIIDYIKMLQKETILKNKNYRRYKRGSVVKVHLGYRIGSEEGGLHYAVVIDNKDTANSPVLTIIPLTSIKNEAQKLKYTNANSKAIILGDEVFQAIKDKLNTQSDLSKVNVEKLSKMKTEGIALVGQITTISKIRIYDPCSSKDLLYSIKLSNKSMDKIDNKLKDLYTKN